MPGCTSHIFGGRAFLCQNKMSDFYKIPNHAAYLINKNGDVFTTKRNRLLTKQINIGGYITFNVDGQYRLAHRLVAMTFLPNPENKLCVNHIDHNRKNTNVDNLEWVTYQENIDHCKRAGRLKPYHFKPLQNNEHNANCKYTDSDVETIRFLHSKGYTHSDVKKIIPISDGQFYRIINNQVRKVS